MAKSFQKLSDARHWANQMEADASEGTPSGSKLPPFSLPRAPRVRRTRSQASTSQARRPRLHSQWPYFLRYAVGRASAGYKFAGETGVVWTSLMLTAIVLMSLVFFLAVLLSDLWVLWRNRGFVPVDFSANHEGRTVYRAVLWIPWE